MRKARPLLSLPVSIKRHSAQNRSLPLASPSACFTSDIERKLRVRPEWFLVGILDGEIVATVMAGYEGHRGWLSYLAVTPEFQRRGFARTIVVEAERLLLEAGCPKINLQIRTSNHGVIEFYRRLGYSVDDVVSMGKRLEHDGAS